MLVAQGEENPYDEALNAIWEDVRSKQYINGGVGVAYGAESLRQCLRASQQHGLLRNLRPDLQRHVESAHEPPLQRTASTPDVIENNLYNSIISCVNLDGNQFFYGNPMQSDNGGLRSDWFGTACCPPNLMRTVCSIGGYIYTQNADGDIAVNQYIGNSAEINVGGTLVNLRPGDGHALVWQHHLYRQPVRGEELLRPASACPTGRPARIPSRSTAKPFPPPPTNMAMWKSPAPGRAATRWKSPSPMEATRVYSDERITHQRRPRGCAPRPHPLRR